MKGESSPILRHRVYTHAHWLASTRAHAINRWHLLHFVALSFFAVRVLRLSRGLFLFPFFFLLLFFPPFSSLLCGTHGRRPGRRVARLACHSHTYTRACVSTHRHAGGKRVRASRDANYLFYVPTGTPWEVRSSFRVTSARVRTSVVPNGTGLPLSPLFRPFKSRVSIY